MLVDPAEAGVNNYYSRRYKPKYSGKYSRATQINYQHSKRGRAPRLKNEKGLSHGSSLCRHPSSSIFIRISEPGFQPGEDHRPPAERIRQDAVEQRHHRKRSEIDRKGLLQFQRPDPEVPGDRRKRRQVGVDRERTDHCQAGKHGRQQRGRYRPTMQFRPFVLSAVRRGQNSGTVSPPLCALNSQFLRAPGPRSCAPP